MTAYQEYGSPLDIETTAKHDFKDGEYFISMSVGSERILKIEVEDESNGKWLGKFDAAYIEELTHKTGNFKQFNIFCSMLESGLNKTSESVMLDLMTYADLESLRSQKINGGPKKGNQNNSSQLNSKRYLIMTYTVEFDRIHYPLSLQFAGKPDTASLRHKVARQQDEIMQLKSHISEMKISVEEPNEEFEQLLRAKEEIQAELDMCKGVLNKTGVAKELRILKKVIQSLESDLLKERSKFKRMQFKKTEECKRLLNELEEVKASERNLKVRCKNLTEELAIMKRASSHSPQMKMPIYVSRWQKTGSGRRSVSQERQPRDKSAGHKTKTPSPSGSRRFNPTAYIEEKHRRQSEARNARGRSRSNSHNHNHDHSGRRSRSGSFGRSTPDISSHVKQRPPSARRSSSAKGFFGPKLKRTSSVGSYGSRHSSFDSDSERDRSQGRSRNRTPNIAKRTTSTGSMTKKTSRRSIGRSAYSSGGSEIDELDERTEKLSRKESWRSGKRKAKKKEVVDDETRDSSLDIANIDARLSALQRFMKTNLNEL